MDSRHSAVNNINHNNYNNHNIYYHHFQYLNNNYNHNNYLNINNNNNNNDDDNNHNNHNHDHNNSSSSNILRCGAANLKHRCSRRDPFVIHSRSSPWGEDSWRSTCRGGSLALGGPHWQEVQQRAFPGDLWRHPHRQQQRLERRSLLRQGGRYHMKSCTTSINWTLQNVMSQ